MRERIGGWMQTASGQRYWPADPEPVDVSITDIAHALAMLCRFGGHCRDFYSVAEHSVLVSYLVPREHALAGLLHDATEAYVVDVPRPLKLELPQYRDIEHLNWLAIAEAFGLPVTLPACVKHADNAILHVEQKALMTELSGRDWCVGETGDIDTRSVHLYCYEPFAARQHFMSRYRQLTTQ